MSKGLPGLPARAGQGCPQLCSDALRAFVKPPAISETVGGASRHGRGWGSNTLTSSDPAQPACAAAESAEQTVPQRLESLECEQGDEAPGTPCLGATRATPSQPRPRPEFLLSARGPTHRLGGGWETTDGRTAHSPTDFSPSQSTRLQRAPPRLCRTKSQRDPRRPAPLPRAAALHQEVPVSPPLSCAHGVRGDQAYTDLCPHYQHVRRDPPCTWGPGNPTWHCSHMRPGPCRPLSCPRSQP